MSSSQHQVLRLKLSRARRTASHHFLPLSTVLVLFIASLGLVSWVVSAFTARYQASSLASSPPVAKSPQTPAPPIFAKNVFIWDVSSRAVLFSKDSDSPIYPASTTKIMTALVVLRHYPLDEVVAVDQSFPEGQSIGFVPGEKMTVEKFLYALLVESGNDAAEILAEHYPGGRSAFVAEMNRLAGEFQLQHTHFANPTGLDEDNHYSSAADLARLADIALHNSLFARIVSTENTFVSTVDSSQTHFLSNTNKLLGKIPGVLGVKTGFTDKAGESLVTVVSRDNRETLFVVLGSTDRFGDTEKLIKWIYPST